MEIFLSAFTAFNVVAGLVALIRGLRLWSPTARDAWRSTRLYYLAIWIACSLPIVALVCTLQAWRAWGAGEASAGPTMVAPLAWLVAMGIVFAVIDIAEDGQLDFGKGPRKS